MSKTGFAMFLAGATVGAAATWLCLRRYYEQIAQEEIDSVKAAFAERKPVNTNIAKNEKSNEKQKENQHKADIAKLKPDLVNYAAKLQEEGYTNYTEHSKKNTEEKKDLCPMNLMSSLRTIMARMTITRRSVWSIMLVTESLPTMKMKSSRILRTLLARTLLNISESMRTIRSLFVTTV